MATYTTNEIKSILQQRKDVWQDMFDGFSYVGKSTTTGQRIHSKIVEIDYLADYFGFTLK